MIRTYTSQLYLLAKSRQNKRHVASSLPFFIKKAMREIRVTILFQGSERRDFSSNEKDKFPLLTVHFYCGPIKLEYFLSFRSYLTMNYDIILILCVNNYFITMYIVS